MNRKQIRSWLMYDWANSAFATTMLAAVLPIYYKEVAGAGLPGNTAENYWGYTQTIAMLLVAIVSPVLGAVADMSGRKLAFLRLFAYMGAVSCFLFAFAGEGDYFFASVLVVLGTLGFSGGNTFYDALLTDLVPPERRDSVSAMGYAYGYIGGGVLLAVNLAMIEGWSWFGFSDKAAATRAAFVTVGLWWFLFSLPIFRALRDPGTGSGLRVRQYAAAGFSQIARTIRGMRRYPELLKYMISYWFFNDGINTIITMATIYGAGIGINTTDLILALVITQFVGIPFTVLFGKLADRIGSKRSLFVSLYIYVLVVVLGYFMQTSLHFYILAFVVGMVQGGSQSIARSIYSKLVPRKQSAEFFGFLSLSSKFSSVAGPFTFALVGTLTGSSRLAILSLVLFFAVGILLLMKVDMNKGALEAESVS
jgi:UMF1 family MFS transporter